MQDLDQIANPTNPGEALRLSRTLEGQGDLDGAERTTRWALDFNPSHAGLLCRLGQIASLRGDKTAALGWVERAIASSPAEVAPRVQFIQLHISHDDLAAAREAVRAALEILPDYPVL